MKTGTLSLKNTDKPAARKSNTTGRKTNRKNSKQQSGTVVAAEATVDRLKMIEETAYYYAEKRGFQPGHEVLDWLEAEKDVDNLLSKSANSVPS